MHPIPIAGQLGQGAGWRPQLDDALARAGGLGFLEVIAEAIGPCGLPRGVAAARERGVCVIPHGVSLSLGSAERPDRRRLERLASVAERTGAPLVLERTGALLLLDLSNLYANAHNHGYDATEALVRYPLGRIAYVHVGGGTFCDGVYHDTHAHPVVPGVLRLVEELFAVVEAPGVMLERDDDFPPEAELAAELRAIADAVLRGHERRAAA